MTLDEVVEHRLTQLEENVDTLFNKVNGFAVSQAATGAKLDSMLLTLGELKESVNRLSSRPVQFWDKFLLALLGAVATAIGAALTAYIL